MVPKNINQLFIIVYECMEAAAAVAKQVYLDTIQISISNVSERLFSFFFLSLNKEFIVKVTNKSNHNSHDSIRLSG